jgi:hypothetical protein
MRGIPRLFNVRADKESESPVAHSYEAQVREIWLLVRLSISQAFKLNKVLAAVKCERNPSLIDHCQGHCGTPQVECGLSDHSRASHKRLGDSNCNLS